MTAGPGRWVLEWRWAAADALHGPWPPKRRLDRRGVAVCNVTGDRSLVLGSTQPATVADAPRLAANGVTLVHRRSGGGAVLVAPHAQVWLDAWIPRDDPLWEDDIVRGAQWLGDVWARALGTLGAQDVSVHRGRVVRTAWSDTVCFAGLGPGEVSAGGRKVVGLAQRRTRDGARLHSMAHLVWDPTPLAVVLALSERDRRQLVTDTASTAAGLVDVLDVPDLPDLPDLPYAPDLPDLPDVPDVPDVPVVANGGVGGMAALRAVEQALVAELSQVEQAPAG